MRSLTDLAAEVGLGVPGAGGGASCASAATGAITAAPTSRSTAPTVAAAAEADTNAGCVEAPARSLTALAMEVGLEVEEPRSGADAGVGEGAREGEDGATVAAAAAAGYDLVDSYLTEVMEQEVRAKAVAADGAAA